MEKIKNSGNGEVVSINKNNTADIKTILEDQLKKFQRLNKLVTDRDLFLAKKSQLNDYLATIETENKSEEMETNICKIVLKDSRTYRDDGALTVSNVFVIKKFIAFMNAEIDSKVEELEKQIVL